jgi:hypothetical protein
MRALHLLKRLLSGYYGLAEELFGIVWKNNNHAFCRSCDRDNDADAGTALTVQNYLLDSTKVQIRTPEVTQKHLQVLVYLL